MGKKPDNKNMLKMITSIILITIGLAGLFFISACRENRTGTVDIINRDYQMTIVGTSKDGFDAPDGLLSKDGKLYMADEGGPAFRIWTNAKEVKSLSSTADGIESPEDFVLDKNENIFFTDDDAGGVWKIDKDGKTSVFAGKDQGLLSTEGIAINSDGEILVGDGKQKKVYQISQSGKVSVFLDVDAGITKPESMVFDEEGNLYIADNEDQILYLLTPEKKLTKIIENQTGFSPESICYSKGVLYITDSDNGKLFKYTKEKGLEKIADFGGVYFKVSGITTDENENIYVSIQTHIDNKHSYILKLERIGKND
jgi:sugar lactone lactonase YvrE